MDNTKTGMLIAERRRALGLTQDELAGKLHVTGKAVSKWERGLSFPGVDLLIPLVMLCFGRRFSAAAPKKIIKAVSTNQKNRCFPFSEIQRFCFYNGNPIILSVKACL